MAYARDFSSIAAFFAGDPAQPDAWRDALARVRRAPRNRAAVVSVLAGQLAARNSPVQARHGAEQLADPAAVAVVTGQQAGLFGGPLYTLLKAITAIQLAREVGAAHGVPAIPVFWVAGEDHDWLEVRGANFLDAEFGRREVVLPDLPGAGVKSVDDLVLDGSVEDAIQAFERALPATEFKSEVVARLRGPYRPGVSMARAFAGWLDSLLGAHGLVVFEGSDPRAPNHSLPTCSSASCRTRRGRSRL